MQLLEPIPDLRITLHLEKEKQRFLRWKPCKASNLPLKMAKRLENTTHGSDSKECFPLCAGQALLCSCETFGLICKLAVQSGINSVQVESWLRHECNVGKLQGILRLPNYSESVLLQSAHRSWLLSSQKNSRR